VARRSPPRATRRRGTIRFHRADLATQSAVRDLAAELRESYDRLDVLAHNAGLSVRSRTETADGIELTLAVNHLAPYLLTRELFDQLAGSAPARVVVTASDLHRRATLDFDDLQFADGYDPLEAYARSKLANVAFTLELADRIPEAAGVTANCLHPGFVPSTNLFRDAALEPGSRSASRGSCPASGRRAEPADRLVRLVASPEYAERTGRYVGEEEMTPADDTVDSETRERLWSVSADLVGSTPTGRERSLAHSGEAPPHPSDSSPRAERPLEERAGRVVVGFDAGRVLCDEVAVGVRGQALLVPDARRAAEQVGPNEEPPMPVPEPIGLVGVAASRRTLGQCRGRADRLRERPPVSIGDDRRPVGRVGVHESVLRPAAVDCGVEQFAGAGVPVDGRGWILTLSILTLLALVPVEQREELRPLRVVARLVPRRPELVARLVHVVREVVLPVGGVVLPADRRSRRRGRP